MSGEYAFEDCSSMTSIALPDSLTSLGVGAFYGCDSLTSIALPDSLTWEGLKRLHEKAHPHPWPVPQMNWPLVSTPP